MKQQFHFTLLAVALCAIASSSIQAAWEIVTPANGATVSPLKPMQRALAMMTEEQLDAFINQEMVDRMEDVTTYPAGIPVEWPALEEASGGYLLCVADNAEMKSASFFACAESSYTLYNLEIGKKYYLQVNALGPQDAEGNSPILQSTPEFNFTVENLAPRVLNVPGVPNVRDLGGRVGLQGRMVPQGMIFRSAAFNDNSPDGKRIGNTRMTEENRAIVLETMKLKTEIDLRWERELAGMNESPVGSEVQYLSIPSTLYAGLFTQQGYENYQKLFPIFTKAENYPIDFHCILGADRTGSLAVVLLATLGVSREEIMRDYAFTSLYTPFLRPPRNIRSVLDGLEKCGQAGDTLSDQAMRYLLQCGIRSSQIYDFLTIVLGEGLEMPKLLAEAKVAEEIQDRFTQPFDGLTATPYIVQKETMMQAGREVSWSAPVWYESPLRSVTSADDGAVLVQLQNTMPNPTTVRLQPNVAAFTAPEYFVLAPMKRAAYCAPNGGMRWTPAELEQFGVVLESQRELLLILQPTTTGLADGIQAIPYAAPQFEPNFSMAPTASAPTVDGFLDDATWQGLAPMAMTNTDGTPNAAAPLVWLRTNAEHDSLYLAVKLQDATPCSMAHDARDAALWQEDSIEVFLSSHGEAKTYQMIFNASDCIWDGIINNGGENSSWSADSCEYKSARSSDGWTIEVVIPLAQFGFESALEFNVCANDNPNLIHYNLFPTQDSFHNRSAISPVLFK